MRLANAHRIIIEYFTGQIRRIVLGNEFLLLCRSAHCTYPDVTTSGWRRLSARIQGTAHQPKGDLRAPGAAAADGGAEHTEFGTSEHCR